MRHSLSKTMVWLCSGSVGVQVRPGWLGLPVRAKFAQAVAIFLRQRLRLGRVAGALFAALGVVEAEGQLGGVPRAGVFQHRRLPGEVVRVDRRRLLLVLQLGHASPRCCASTAHSAPAAAHIRQRPDALLRMRLLHGGDQRGGLLVAIDFGESGVPLALRWGGERMLLPSSLTEPISMGTFFEISGAASRNDRMLMTVPSTRGHQPARGGPAAADAMPRPRRIHLGRDGVAGRDQLGPLHLLQRGDVVASQCPSSLTT